MAGSVTTVFDHHQRELQSKMTELEHRHGSVILAKTHIHLDHHTCLEVAIVRGRAKEVRKLFARLKSLRGVKHSSLTMSTTARGLE